LGRLLGVLAFLEGASSDALEQLGVVAEGAYMIPGDVVGSVPVVIVADLICSSMLSISAFLETKAASACSLDLAIWFCILVLRIGNFDEPMNALRRENSKLESRSSSETYFLTSGPGYGWADDQQP
jgi:hypothetical protein